MPNGQVGMQHIPSRLRAAEAVANHPAASLSGCIVVQPHLTRESWLFDLPRAGNREPGLTGQGRVS